MPVHFSPETPSEDVLAFKLSRFVMTLRCKDHSSVPGPLITTHAAAIPISFRITRPKAAMSWCTSSGLTNEDRAPSLGTENVPGSATRPGYRLSTDTPRHQGYSSPHSNVSRRRPRSRGTGSHVSRIGSLMMLQWLVSAGASDYKRARACSGLLCSLGL